MLFLYLWLGLGLVQAQFRGFSSPRQAPASNHDLLKQIVDTTPEETAAAEAAAGAGRLSRFGGRRGSILDRARSRPNTFSPSRPRFTPTVPRFGSGATSLNVVTHHQQQQQQQAGSRCQELRAENELLKQLVETLTKQHKAAEDKVNLLQVCATLRNMQIISRYLNKPLFARASCSPRRPVSAVLCPSSARPSGPASASRASLCPGR